MGEIIVWFLISVFLAAELFYHVVRPLYYRRLASAIMATKKQQLDVDIRKIYVAEFLEGGDVEVLKTRAQVVKVKSWCCQEPIIKCMAAIKITKGACVGDCRDDLEVYLCSKCGNYGLYYPDSPRDLAKNARNT